MAHATVTSSTCLTADKIQPDTADVVMWELSTTRNTLPSRGVPIAGQDDFNSWREGNCSRMVLISWKLQRKIIFFQVL